MKLVCPKCGSGDYWTYKDFPWQNGIPKCKKCSCPMVDVHMYRSSR